MDPKEVHCGVQVDPQHSSRQLLQDWLKEGADAKLLRVNPATWSQKQSGISRMARFRVLADTDLHTAVGRLGL